MSRHAAREPIATWWKITRYGIEIEPVPVLAFTDKTVTFWNGGREERNNQISDWYEYLPTWEQARARLLSRLEQKAYNAQCALEDMRNKAEKVRSLAPPSPSHKERRDDE